MLWKRIYERVYMYIFGQRKKGQVINLNVFMSVHNNDNDHKNKNKNNNVEKRSEQLV